MDRYKPKKPFEEKDHRKRAIMLEEFTDEWFDGIYGETPNYNRKYTIDLIPYCIDDEK
jgi:hypothetical protein